MRGDSGPPLAPTKSGSSATGMIRTERQIIRDQREHLRQHRHHARLVALAGDDDDIAGAGRRHILPLERQRFGDTQSGTIEQRQHRGIACEYPRLAIFARAQIGVGDAFRRRDRERLRQCLRHLRRAHGIERRDLAFAVALQKTREGARAGKPAHQRARGDIVRAPRRHEGAHVLRGELGQLLERRRAAEMLGQKSEKLRNIARIGVERFRRHPPLMAQIREPASDLDRDIGSGKGKIGLWIGHPKAYLIAFLHPSLSAWNRANLPTCRKPRRSWMSWCPWPSTRPIPTACRRG